MQQADGDSATASTSVNVFAAPPTADTGASINSGDAYTRDKQVTLALSWPAYASAARVSNDGGFSNARTVALGPSVPWVLDDSVAGRATKVVYVRFIGDGIDSTKTFSDDIILDTQAPAVAQATATRTAAKYSGPRGFAALLAKPPKRATYNVRVRAQDRLTGVRLIDINTRKKAGTGFRYRSAVRVTLPKATNLYVRVRDGAGNWTRWRKVRVQPASAKAIALGRLLLGASSGGPLLVVRRPFLSLAGKGSPPADIIPGGRTLPHPSRKIACHSPAT